MKLLLVILTFLSFTATAAFGQQSVWKDPQGRVEWKNKLPNQCELFITHGVLNIEDGLSTSSLSISRQTAEEILTESVSLALKGHDLYEEYVSSSRNRLATDRARFFGDNQQLLLFEDTEIEVKLNAYRSVTQFADFFVYNKKAGNRYHVLYDYGMKHALEITAPSSKRPDVIIRCVYFYQNGTGLQSYEEFHRKGGAIGNRLEWTRRGELVRAEILNEPEPLFTKRNVRRREN